MGQVEIAAMLGVTKQRAGQLTSRPDFPEPEAVLAVGKVWSRAAVESWVAGWRRRPGREPSPR